MKNTILTCICFLAGIALTYAQPNREKIGEKLKEERIAFVKKKLALTAEEDKKFTPLYTKMIDEMDALRESKKSSARLEDLDLTFMTDEECEKAINDFLSHKEKEVILLKNYNTEFKKVLPVKKVAMIYKAEHEFKREILKKLRKGLREKNKR